MIEKLQSWYRMHCDGDWEHSYGITIDTLDNPGWCVTVDLTDTLLEDVKFSAVCEGDPDSEVERWIDCRKKNDTFIGMGSPECLQEILSIFFKWAEENTDTSKWDDKVEQLHVKCLEYDKQENMIEYLRDIYNAIEDIPNEHPKRQDLVGLFNECWNKAIK